MGSPKALLEWHGSTLVRRVAGIVARGVDGPVVLVRSPGQPLPRLPDSFEVLDDLEEGRGPLGGLLVGLESLAGRGAVAYVSSTDAPLLHPAFVRRVAGELTDGVDASVPYVRGFLQPLAAAYRVGLAPVVADLLASGRLRTASLLEVCRWRELDEQALLADVDVKRLDPDLDSVTNLNGPAEYEAARALPAPEVQVEWPGGSRAASPGRVTIRAATLGAAADAIGVPLGRHVVATLNGAQISPDPEEPLVAGDEVFLVRGEAGRH